MWKWKYVKVKWKWNEVEVKWVKVNWSQSHWSRTGWKWKSDSNIWKWKWKMKRHLTARPKSAIAQLPSLFTRMFLVLMSLKGYWSFNMKGFELIDFFLFFRPSFFFWAQNDVVTCAQWQASLLCQRSQCEGGKDPGFSDVIIVIIIMFIVKVGKTLEFQMFQQDVKY